MTLILASQSASRRKMLTAAGIAHQAIRPEVNEDDVKAELRAADLSAPELAMALAESKALSIQSSGLILGCDQTLACADASMLDKAADRTELAAQLGRLSGTTHHLHSAATIAENGQIIWRAIDRAAMTMRPLSASFIATYLEEEGDGLLGCVGGYRIEGRGAQLFSGVDGSHFTVQGLPLLPLLAFLRERGFLPA